MTVSPQLYNKAQEIKNTLYPSLRTVSMVDTLMPDDYNVPYQIMKALLEAVGKTSPIPHREIKMKDDVYGEHVSDLRTICYELWLYIYQKLRDPYTTDPEFFELKNILDSMRLPKHADELKPDEWNSISNYCRRMVDLILRYPAGFLEPWNNWEHIHEDWSFAPETYEYLDTSTYVSPLSSLTSDERNPTYLACMLKKQDYINVPYVQIETFAKTKGDWGETGGALGFFFRSIDAYIFTLLKSYRIVGDIYYQIYMNWAPYMLFFDTYQTKCELYWVETFEGDYELIGEQTLTDKPAHANEWNKYRATLSKYGTGINIKLEYWDGIKWKTMASFNHDSDTIWSDYPNYYHGIQVCAALIVCLYPLELFDARTWIDDTLVIKL